MADSTLAEDIHELAAALRIVRGSLSVVWPHIKMQLALSLGETDEDRRHVHHALTVFEDAVGVRHADIAPAIIVGFSTAPDGSAQPCVALTTDPFILSQCQYKDLRRAANAASIGDPKALEDWLEEHSHIRSACARLGIHRTGVLEALRVTAEATHWSR